MRSGTNYVQYLLERNFRCRVTTSAYGWKHAPLPIPVRRRCFAVPIVAVIKEPFAFLVSLHRYRDSIDRNIDAPRDWDAFLTQPITIYNGRPGRTPRLTFANPLHYWNTLNLNLATLPAGLGEVHVVAYEAILAAPEAEARKLAEALRLRRRPGPFVLPADQVGRGKRGIGRLVSPYGNDTESTPFSADYYRDAAYMAQFSAEQRAFVRAEVNPALAALMGYDLSGQP